jgi:hypothetical protein
MKGTIALVSCSLGISCGLTGLERTAPLVGLANEVPAKEAIAEPIGTEIGTDTAENIAKENQATGEQIMPALPGEMAKSPQDPLNSPHPIPWSWVLETQSTMQAQGQTGIRYYRSPGLLSPDGDYAAYSRVQLHVDTDPYRNRVDSVLFVENMKNGSLGVIPPNSPFAAALGTGTPNPSPASISLLIPVSWSPDSNQLLAREFDGILNSSDITDYAIVWDRQRNQTHTIAPQGMSYSTAVLLGWSSRQPGQVLFQAGDFGQNLWALWNVGTEGNTTIALEDEPLVMGKTIINPWDGPQAYWTPAP